MSKDMVNAGAAAISQLLVSKVNDLAVSKEMKSLLAYIVVNSKALFDFGYEYAKQNPRGSVDPNKLLVAFLTSKGKSLKDFGIKVIDSEVLLNLNAVINLALDVRSSLKYGSVPVAGIGLVIGFLINDAGKFLANFTPAQRAYYELFLRDSNTTYRLTAP